MVDLLFNYSLLNSLLVKDLEIPIFVEKEFTVQCCIRGYHTYQAQWNAEVGAKLNTAPDTRPAADLPAEFCFKTCNEKLFFQMKEKTLVEIEKFEEKRKQMEEEKKKKKKPKTDKKKLDK